VVAGAEIAAIVLGRRVLRLVVGPLVALQIRGVPAGRMGWPLREAEVADRERIAVCGVEAGAEEVHMEDRQRQQLVVDKRHRDMAPQ
jgi:hypothetical protein